MKICALMIPKEMKLEHSGGVIKAMTDEELDAALEALQQLLADREAAANVIEGSAEPVVLPAPEAQSPEATPEPTQKHKTNRLMREADTAVGPRERKPRSKVRSPAST
jgi:ATP-dependent DNA ligase